MSIYDAPEWNWNAGDVTPAEPGTYSRRHNAKIDYAHFDGVSWFHVARSKSGDVTIYKKPHRRQNSEWRASPGRGENRLPEEGDRFALLSFVNNIGYEKNSRRWLAKFKCDCGNEKAMNLYEVRSGKIKSCGCLRDSDERVRKFQESYAKSIASNPAERLDNNRKIGDANRGQAKPIGANGKWSLNVSSKFWELISPNGTVISGWNLSQLIRDNAEMFEPDDLAWGKSGCRASQRLSSLKGNRPRNARSWKGWRLGICVPPARSPDASFVTGL